MIRRPRRTVPAVIVALVLLAGAVLVVWSCVQVLTGQAPVIPFTALATAAAALTWADLPVLIGGGILAVIGIALLIVAAAPGRPTVLALADRPDRTRDEATSRDDMDRAVHLSGTAAQPDAGATRRSVARAISTAAAGVPGVDHATARLAARSVIATVHTPLRGSTELTGQVSDAITAALDDIGLTRPLRVRVATRAPARST